MPAPERVPVLTRHSGVVRLHSWQKGFVHEKWVRIGLKRALLGPGDWIEMTGSGAQADVLFPDLTTFLMRKAAEVQILNVGRAGEGGGENEIALLGGISFDISLRSVPTRIELPNGLSIRGQNADLLILFELAFDRIRVRHARGSALQQVVRQLPAHGLCARGRPLALRPDDPAAIGLANQPPQVQATAGKLGVTGVEHTML